MSKNRRQTGGLRQVDAPNPVHHCRSYREYRRLAVAMDKDPVWQAIIETRTKPGSEVEDDTE